MDDLRVPFLVPPFQETSIFCHASNKNQCSRQVLRSVDHWAVGWSFAPQSPKWLVYDGKSQSGHQILVHLWQVVNCARILWHWNASPSTLVWRHTLAGFSVSLSHSHPAVTRPQVACLAFAFAHMAPFEETTPHSNLWQHLSLSKNGESPQNESLLLDCSPNYVTRKYKKWPNYAGWCPPVISWFINPINYTLHIFTTNHS